MANARVTIDCQHCGKRTVIDLQEEMSMQRCTKCGLRLNSVNTSAKEKKRKRVSGDPMIKRYEKVAPPEEFRKKRRRFASRKWLAIKVILLLLFFALLVGTAIFVMMNPMGYHRPW